MTATQTTIYLATEENQGGLCGVCAKAIAIALRYGKDGWCINLCQSCFDKEIVRITSK